MQLQKVGSLELVSALVVLRWFWACLLVMSTLLSQLDDMATWGLSAFITEIFGNHWICQSAFIERTGNGGNGLSSFTH